MCNHNTPEPYSVTLLWHYKIVNKVIIVSTPYIFRYLAYSHAIHLSCYIHKPSKSPCASHSNPDVAPRNFSNFLRASSRPSRE